MIVEIDDQGYERWLLEFKASVDPSKELGISRYPIYGQIAENRLMSTDKFTIVVDHERAYESFLKNPPLSLRGDIYVMLVDTEQGIVVREEQLSSYDYE